MATVKVISNFELLRLIREARSTEKSTRIVLNALALRANPKNRHSCWPSRPQIVIDTQLDLKTVRRALKRLEAGKLIAITKRLNQSDLYFINVALLQRQAAGNKIAKDEIPECPFDEPTIEQERQLNADEATITFDETPDAAPTSTEEPDTVEPSPISISIQSLKYLSEKMTGMDADRMATSLMKSHEEEDVLQAIASLDDYALREAYKAKNPIGYLRKCLNAALEDLENKEPPPQNIESCNPGTADGEDEYADEPELDHGDEPEEPDESEPVYFSVSPDGEVMDEPVADGEVADDDPNIYFDERADDAAIARCLEAIPEGQCHYFHAEVGYETDKMHELKNQVNRLIYSGLGDIRGARHRTNTPSFDPGTKRWRFGVHRLITDNVKVIHA